MSDTFIKGGIVRTTIELFNTVLEITIERYKILFSMAKLK